MNFWSFDSTSSRYTSSRRGFPAGNPIANALVILVGALVIGVSIVLGFFAFVILASILIVFSALVGIRLWWFNRKLEKAHRQRQKGEDAGGGSATCIEGEYHVVVEEQDEPDRR